MTTTAENAHRQWATDEEYVAHGGTRCPACGSIDIEGNEITFDDGHATQEMSCAICDAEWTDTYKMTGYV